MSENHHKHPPYVGIFWVLSILTAIEFMWAFGGFSHMTIVLGLLALAFGKAIIVARYYMHLKFEKAILSFIPFMGFSLGLFFMFMVAYLGP